MGTNVLLVVRLLRRWRCPTCTAPSTPACAPSTSRTLTEAAQSLGAGWVTILSRVILPNVLVAVLSGAFLTFAIVIGEFTMAALLNRPAFGPFMQTLGANRAYEPAALAVIAFGITWGCMGLIQIVSRFAPKPPSQPH